MSDQNPALYAVVVGSFSLALCSVGLLVGKKLAPHQLPLPPGPKGLPFIGNALQVNKNEPWLTYSEWKKTYGEIVSCNLMGQTYIIVNSERVAKALLDQRSSIYSDRPVIRTTALFGMEYNTGHMHYGNTWKTHRKIFHQGFGSSMIPEYHMLLVEKARTLLVNLLHSPEHFELHMRTYAISLTMSIVYGYNVLPKNDPFVEPIEETIRIVILMTPERAIMLNLFPWLLKLPSWFPGAEFRQLAKRCRELSPKVRDTPFQFVKECLAKDIENKSVVAQLLQDETIAAEDREVYEQNIKDCATSSFIAGTDTTQSGLITLALVFVLYPEVQERAQALIDRVVGRDRLPTFADRASLPYIDAILRETLRWGSLVPMSVPHMVRQDDIFEQCLIPKGSAIIPNVWGMARDEEIYPDPTTFKPERHLDEDGNLLEEDSSSIHFGFGRRICPGRYLADASTWIAVASMLTMFKFGKAIDPAGYEIDVFPQFTGGVALRPVPFSCSITPRFEGASELLE